MFRRSFFLSFFIYLLMVGWGVRKGRQMGEISHLNSIDKFLDRFMIVSPGLFEMLKRLNARFNNQSLPRRKKWVQHLITGKKAKGKIKKILLLYHRARLNFITLESTSEIFLRASSSGIFVCMHIKILFLMAS